MRVNQDARWRVKREQGYQSYEDKRGWNKHSTLLNFFVRSVPFSHFVHISTTLAAQYTTHTDSALKHSTSPLSKYHWVNYIGNH